MAFKVTKDTIIGDIMDHDPSTAEYFYGDGNALSSLPVIKRRVIGTGLYGSWR